MRRYRVTLGDLDGTDYGQFVAATPEDAIVSALADADPSRRCDSPQLLSQSADYGRGSHALDGNGAQDRSAWWYVVDSQTGRFAGVYAIDGTSE